MNIYVGFLPDGLTDAQLRAKFEEFGKVFSAKIVKDRDTGLSRGFGFVEMNDKNEAQAAIEGLQGWTNTQGKSVKVNVAKEKEDNRRFASRWN
ncbi:MAG: RNA recognition motif domain-containing protein [Candidatus Sericytochromatia bacterium]|jgi:RNA recognition motif-containing protein